MLQQVECWASEGYQPSISADLSWADVGYSTSGQQLATKRERLLGLAFRDGGYWGRTAVCQVCVHYFLFGLLGELKYASKKGTDQSSWRLVRSASASSEAVTYNFVNIY